MKLISDSLMGQTDLQETELCAYTKPNALNNATKSRIQYLASKQKLPDIQKSGKYDP